MSVKLQLMAEQWDEFAAMVLPDNCSAIQRQEMKRAFYAGAHSILFRVIAAFAPETEVTNEDLIIMQGLVEELEEFAKLAFEGRA